MCAVAEALPFGDACFDASMAVLTVHHWTDKARGFRGMRRVTRGKIAILMFDPSCQYYWLAEYLPETVTLDEGKMPLMSAYEAGLGPVELRPSRCRMIAPTGFSPPTGAGRRPISIPASALRSHPFGISMTLTKNCRSLRMIWRAAPGRAGTPNFSTVSPWTSVTGSSRRNERF